MRRNALLSFLGSIALGTTLFSLSAQGAQALAVAPVFGDHMVLQRERPLPVWGRAEPGSVVQVSFGGQSRETKTSADGAWKVVLGALPASATPRPMTVASGASKLSFEDVLVGEVWLCSGQSNMQFKLANCADGAAEVAAAAHPELRLNMGKGWSAASPQSVAEFSGVAYFFGRKLHAETGVPVGLIARALGGTPIEWWTPKAKLERVAYATAALANPPAKWVKYVRTVEAWKQKVATEGRQKAGRKPPAPGSAEEEVLASIYVPESLGSLFAQHLEPMVGYGMRGVIWYQGERNAKAGAEAAQAYRALLVNMITSWRELWGQGDFPFVAVQLPMFSEGGEGWAMVQQAQAAAVGDVPNAACLDLRDQPDDGLHPKNKKPVGERLADLAIQRFLKSVP